MASELIHPRLNDCCLLEWSVSQRMDVVRAVLLAPGGLYLEVVMTGVLWVEFETTLAGEPEALVNVDAVVSKDDDERRRWEQRLRSFGEDDTLDVHHLLFESSHHRGWGEREGLRGISVVCLGFEVHDVTEDQGGAHGWSPPVIPGGE